MSIAIYQGCTYVHYEMLGYLIEYFKYTKIYNISIYAHSNIISREWKDIYEKILDVKMEWIDPILYNPENHINTIVTTEDDLSFKEEWLNNYLDKIIVIGHNTKSYRNLDSIRIHNRFLAKLPNNLWAIPCYFGINKEQKNKILNELNVINVTCVGVQNNPPSIQFLKDLITNFQNTDVPIHIHIISRYMIYNYTDVPDNVHFYKNCSTLLMMDIIIKSHYILCCENENNNCPIHDSISGAIGLSFSFYCQLIIPNIWQLFYGFSSAIGYNDNHVQKNGETKITLSPNINVEEIYNETYELVLHRNKTLDLVLNTSLMTESSKTNPLIQLLNKLGFTDFPTVYFNVNKQLSESELNIHKRDFRELHFIAKGYSHDYIFKHSSLNSINNISTAIYFEIVNSNIESFWDILNTRHYKDIILIYGCDLNEIRSKYKKHCMVYTIDLSLIHI
jgi:hypothetical protein